MIKLSNNPVRTPGESREPVVWLMVKRDADRDEEREGEREERDEEREARADFRAVVPRCEEKRCEEKRCELDRSALNLPARDRFARGRPEPVGRGFLLCVGRGLLADVLFFLFFTC